MKRFRVFVLLVACGAIMSCGSSDTVEALESLFDPPDFNAMTKPKANLKDFANRLLSDGYDVDLYNFSNSDKDGDLITYLSKGEEALLGLVMYTFDSSYTLESIIENFSMDGEYDFEYIDDFLVNGFTFKHYRYTMDSNAYKSTDDICIVKDSEKSFFVVLTSTTISDSDTSFSATPYKDCRELIEAVIPMSPVLVADFSMDEYRYADSVSRMASGASTLGCVRSNVSYVAFNANSELNMQYTCDSLEANLNVNFDTYVNTSCRDACYHTIQTRDDSEVCVYFDDAAVLDAAYFITNGYKITLEVAPKFTDRAIDGVLANLTWSNTQSFDPDPTECYPVLAGY